MFRYNRVGRKKENLEKKEIFKLYLCFLIKCYNSRFYKIVLR